MHYKNTNSVLGRTPTLLREAGGVPNLGAFSKGVPNLGTFWPRGTQAGRVFREGYPTWEHFRGGVPNLGTFWPRGTQAGRVFEKGTPSGRRQKSVKNPSWAHLAKGYLTRARFCKRVPKPGAFSQRVPELKSNFTKGYPSWEKPYIHCGSV